MSEVNGWKDEGTFSGGTILGDPQVGEDHTHSYVKRNDDGTFTVLLHTFGACKDDDDDDGLPFYVGEVTQVIVCTDPDNPGATEVTSEIEYGDGSVLAYATLEKAEAEAQRLAANDIRFVLR